MQLEPEIPPEPLAPPAPEVPPVPAAPPAPVAPAATPPPDPAAPRSSLGPHLRVIVMVYGVVTLFAFGFALFSGTLGRFLGDARPSPAELLAGLAVGGLLALGTIVGERLWAPFKRAARALTTSLGAVTVPEALALAAASGVAEELLFRGALWPTLGLLGTSLLFGLVHFVPRRALWIYPLYAAAAGFALGLLREQTGSVFPPILAHIVVNAINLTWIGRRARSAARDGPSGAAA